MRAADLVDLDRLLGKADHVVSLREVHAGRQGSSVIALRHDVDDNPGSLPTALKMAQWEAERGYRSTYFMLHGSSYWPALHPAIEQLATLGHEVGLHANGIADALRTGRNPDEILNAALSDLRATGVPVIGVAGHGDQLCHTARFCNDEQFSECARPDLGAADRTLSHADVTVTLAPSPLANFGLSYEALRLPRGHYQSDSGGHWYEPMQDTIDGFPFAGGPLQVLQHSDWWGGCFE